MIVKKFTGGSSPLRQEDKVFFEVLKHVPLAKPVSRVRREDHLDCSRHRGVIVSQNSPWRQVIVHFYEVLKNPLVVLRSLTSHKCKAKENVFPLR